MRTIPKAHRVAVIRRAAWGGSCHSPTFLSNSVFGCEPRNISGSSRLVSGSTLEHTSKPLAYKSGTHDSEHHSELWARPSSECSAKLPKVGQVEPALWRRRRSHSPTHTKVFAGGTVRKNSV